MKGQINQIMRFFCIICTGSMIGAGICISVSNPDAVLDVGILWQIIVVSFLAACLIPIFYSKKEMSKKQYLIRTFIHYLGTNAILIGCGLKFDWIGLTRNIRIPFFIIVVTIVYVVITISTYYIDHKMSKQLNQALSAYQQKRQNSQEE